MVERRIKKDTPVGTPVLVEEVLADGSVRTEAGRLSFPYIGGDVKVDLYLRGKAPKCAPWHMVAIM